MELKKTSNGHFLANIVCAHNLFPNKDSSIREHHRVQRAKARRMMHLVRLTVLKQLGWTLGCIKCPRRCSCIASTARHMYCHTAEMLLRELHVTIRQTAQSSPLTSVATVASSQSYTTFTCPTTVFRRLQATSQHPPDKLECKRHLRDQVCLAAAADHGHGLASRH